jgi:hypothetical protein
MIDLKKSLRTNIQGFYLDEYLKHEGAYGRLNPQFLGDSAPLSKN